MFQYDVTQYQPHELCAIFDISPDQYDGPTLYSREKRIRDNIVQDKSIPADVKHQTIVFLDQAKTLLLQKLSSGGMQQQQQLSTNKDMNNVNNMNNVKDVNDYSLEHLTPAPSIQSAFSSEKSNIPSYYKNMYHFNQDELVTSTVINPSSSANLIQRPITPYTSSMPSEYFPGTINPLAKRILRKTVNIDTRFRENYYTTSSSNFHLELPLRLTNVVSMQLSALEFPITFYAISKAFSNNYFTIQSPPDTGIPLLITVPDGNYKPDELVLWINTFLINTLDPYYSTIQLQADVQTGRMLIGLTSGTVPFTLFFALDANGNGDKIQPLPLKLGWMMGFRGGLYVENTTYLSEGIIDLLGPRYLYMSVDDFHSNVDDNFYATFTHSFLNTSILARISLQGTPFQFVSQNNLNLLTTPRAYFGPVDILKLHIQLLDEYGRPVQLNNMDYSFCLSFQTLYDL
jgi:hypothetical protein